MKICVSELNNLSLDFCLMKSLKSRGQKFCLQNLNNAELKLYPIENSKTRRQNSEVLDEMAHNEPPHQDLRC